MIDLAFFNTAALTQTPMTPQTAINFLILNVFVCFRCMYEGIVLLFWRFVCFFCHRGKKYIASIQSQNVSFQNIFTIACSLLIICFITSEMFAMLTICTKCCRIQNITQKPFVFMLKTPLLCTSTLMEIFLEPLALNIKLKQDQVVLCLTSGRYFQSCLF